MKLWLLPMTTLCIGLVGCDQASKPSDETTHAMNSTEKHTLTVNVSNLTAEGGVLSVGLYGQDEQMLEEKKVSANEIIHKVVFTDLEGGYYSVQTYQDIDSNQQLDMNGYMPLEPLGFSNNPTLQGPPTFAMVGFEVSGNTTQDIVLVDYR
ncbi:DUF2141 domain-containing protein [Vibrio sp. YMD68]|uniref:DUF2141 domain-containing protein n=1 Tax=Vibrio sp. YMD68 TaxID=3042300 RepID=UPI00249AEB2F|nr:DUF2141 domain-containing protein [Vibrio sp. YMD68]WGV98597.1 DUF2141 domain-containing protein [Vibrio sp. YMD68]